jgi:PBP1b-binding outer membrane lipoprotein LpoB
MKYLIVALALISGCSQNTQPVPDQPKTETPQVRKVSKFSAIINPDVLEIKEVCYDGVLYLLNADGGITPKIVDPLKMSGEGC